MLFLLREEKGFFSKFWKAFVSLKPISYNKKPTQYWYDTIKNMQIRLGWHRKEIYGKKFPFLL